MEVGRKISCCGRNDDPGTLVKVPCSIRFQNFRSFDRVGKDVESRRRVSREDAGHLGEDSRGFSRSVDGPETAAETNRNNNNNNKNPVEANEDKQVQVDRVRPNKARRKTAKNQRNKKERHQVRVMALDLKWPFDETTWLMTPTRRQLHVRSTDGNGQGRDWQAIPTQDGTSLPLPSKNHPGSTSYLHMESDRKLNDIGCGTGFARLDFAGPVRRSFCSSTMCGRLMDAAVRRKWALPVAYRRPIETHTHAGASRIFDEPALINSDTLSAPAARTPAGHFPHTENRCAQEVCGGHFLFVPFCLFVCLFVFSLPRFQFSFFISLSLSLSSLIALFKTGIGIRLIQLTRLKAAAAAAAATVGSLQKVWFVKKTARNQMSNKIKKTKQNRGKCGSSSGNWKLWRFLVRCNIERYPHFIRLVNGP